MDVSSLFWTIFGNTQNYMKEAYVYSSWPLGKANDDNSSYDPLGNPWLTWSFESPGLVLGFGI